MATPSVAMIPSGYKDGTLYNVLPNNAAGDFDVTRGSLATRVNSNGLIEEVVGDDTPRIDYTDGGCPVLLTEPQSTNLINNSNDMLASNWSQTTATVTLSSTINPFGNSECYRVERVGLGAQLGGVTSATIEEEYTYSIYLRKISGSGVVNMKDVNNSTQQVTITDEWQRYSVTGVANSATGRYYLSLGSDGDVIEASFAQLEELSYATSLIPTYGTVRTRYQDTVTGAGTSSDFNSEEGVLFAEVSALNSEAVSKRISLSDGTNNNRVVITLNGVSASTLIRRNGVTEVSMAHTVVITDLNKIAVKYKENDSALWVNGVEVGTDNIGITFSANTLTELNLTDGSSGSNLFGKTSQIQVFKTALSDFELQQLTTI